MGQLIGEIELTPLNSDEGRNWCVDAPATYVADNGDRITIEQGDLTDLASTPRAIWWLYPPEGLWTIPAIFHDKGYRVQKYTRQRYDEILIEFMKDKGCSWLTRFNFYHAVRLFGWEPWDQYKGAKNGRSNP